MKSLNLVSKFTRKVFEEFKCTGRFDGPRGLGGPVSKDMAADVYSSTQESMDWFMSMDNQDEYDSNPAPGAVTLIASEQPFDVVFQGDSKNGSYELSRIIGERTFEIIAEFENENMTSLLRIGENTDNCMAFNVSPTGGHDFCTLIKR